MSEQEARPAPEIHVTDIVLPNQTWASKHLPLTDWLADELNQRYDVSATLAPAWVAANAVLPLLDGLDEVAANQR